MPTNKELLQKNKTLREEIEKLKKHYQSDLYEWKEKHQSLQDMLDLYIEASNDDKTKEDLEDYKLFCDAFDVPYAMEAIHNHWRNLPDECKEELTKKGLNPK
jgi:DNA-binding ferritin-like protein (Dps family)